MASPLRWQRSSGAWADTKCGRQIGVKLCWVSGVAQAGILRVDEYQPVSVVLDDLVGPDIACHEAQPRTVEPVRPVFGVNRFLRQNIPEVPDLIGRRQPQLVAVDPKALGTIEKPFMGPDLPLFPETDKEQATLHKRGEGQTALVLE